MLVNVSQGHSLLESKFAVEKLENVRNNEERLSFHTAGPAIFEKISHGINEKDWDLLFEGLNCEKALTVFQKSTMNCVPRISKLLRKGK